MTDAHPGSSQRVLVSYSAPQTILSSTKWQQVRAALTAQLPLRNIHWKSASRTSIRTIQELDVSLVPLDTLRDEHTQIPVTLLEKPLLHIYVVVCQVRIEEALSARPFTDIGFRTPTWRDTEPP